MRLNLMRRPRLGTVLGFTALIVAVVGTASATPSRTIIRKGDLAKGSVTAKALAPGAIHAKALAKGSVISNALGKGSVGSVDLAPNAVTKTALAPDSVYGGAMGGTLVRSAAVGDADEVAENGKWTPSGIAIANCGAGERPLSGGVLFTDSGNNEVAIIKSGPAETGWVGQITSNSGGTAKAEVQVVCLK